MVVFWFFSLALAVSNINDERLLSLPGRSGAD